MGVAVSGEGDMPPQGRAHGGQGTPIYSWQPPFCSWVPNPILDGAPRLILGAPPPSSPSPAFKTFMLPVLGTDVHPTKMVPVPSPHPAFLPHGPTGSLSHLFPQPPLISGRIPALPPGL